MNPKEKFDTLNAKVTYEDSFLLKISEIVKDCQFSENLMLGIYVIEEDHFIYCNQSFRNIFGKNSTKLLEEGWNSWFARVDAKEKKYIKESVMQYFDIPEIRNPLNLLYHVTNFQGQIICLRHEVFLHKLEKRTLAINYFFDVSDKERLENYFICTDKIGGSKSCQKQPLHISTREKEVLRLIANGYSSKEIANLLFISNHTAISHRKHLLEKFQVKNTAHLVTKATGLIQM